MDPSLWYNLILSVVGAVLTTALAFLTKYLQAKFTGEQISKAKTIAQTVVEAVEQIASTLGHPITGPEKYDMAAKYFAELSKKAGLNLTFAQTKALIEAAVAQLNAFWADLTPVEPPVVNPQ